MSEQNVHPRLRYLLARELDGDLTRVEKDELDRLCLLEPRARRDRAGWIRVQKAMTPGPPVKLASASLAAKVMAKAERRELPRLHWQGWLLALAASGASLAIGLLWIERPEPAASPAYAAEHRSTPPVEVDLELSAQDGDSAALVQVQF